jgi:hypothetical protein
MWQGFNSIDFYDSEVKREKEIAETLPIDYMQRCLVWRLKNGGLVRRVLDSVTEPARFKAYREILKEKGELPPECSN